MPKSDNGEHKIRMAIAARDKLAAHVNRLELELFKGLPKMFEDEVNTRKAEIEALRKTLAKAERKVTGGRRAKAPDPQMVMFE
jgi:hypothetical protein